MSAVGVVAAGAMLSACGGGGTAPAAGGSTSSMGVGAGTTGGGSVNQLMLIQPARGLFHKAIVQSGPAVQMATREDGTRTARQMLEHLGMDAADAGRLRELPATTLLEAQVKVLAGVSRAAFADWGFGIFRTDPDSKRHKGLTFILFDLNSPGITRRPIRQLHGDTGFAELFFDEVRVPVENCLAGEGEGWNVAMATAGFERGLMLRSPGRFQAAARRLVELFRQHEAAAAPSAREAVMRAWMDTQAYAYNTYAVAAKIMAGGKIGAEASLNKIFWSELDRSMHRTAMQLLGAAALAGSPAVQIDLATVQTNIVVFHLSPGAPDAASLVARAMGSLADAHELGLGTVGPQLAVDIHGEQRRAAVEQRGERTHQRRQEPRHHDAAQGSRGGGLAQ